MSSCSLSQDCPLRNSFWRLINKQLFPGIVFIVIDVNILIIELLALLTIIMKIELNIPHAIILNASYINKEELRIRTSLGYHVCHFSLSAYSIHDNPPQPLGISHPTLTSILQLSRLSSKQPINFFVFLNLKTIGRNFLKQQNR